MRVSPRKKSPVLVANALAAAEVRSSLWRERGRERERERRREEGRAGGREGENLGFRV